MSIRTPQFDRLSRHCEVIVKVVLSAADPALAVRRAWPSGLLVGKPLHILAIGKASLAMAAGASSSSAGIVRGLVIAGADGIAASRLDGSTWKVLPADHPLATQRNVEAAREADSFARAVPRDHAFVALISGGGSAHLTLPAPGIGLEDLTSLSSRLMRSGATINELNTVRKHAEMLKGGRLGANCRALTRLALVLSDVIGDHVDVIASGPTTPDPTSFGDAIAVLARHGLADSTNPIVRHLQRGANGDVPETIKPGDPRLDKFVHSIIGNNRLIVDAAAAAARDLGFSVVETWYAREGEASTLGRQLAQALRRYSSRADRPIAVVWGGEPTVTVGDSTAKGGPSQELALAAAVELDGLDRVGVLTFSSDGSDGPTDTAGAIIHGSTCSAARAMGLDPVAALARHGSHELLRAVKAQIYTGPTGANLNHIAVGLVYR